ncbi:hypothetical protein Aperf_G00000059929 [Anoplocephala perfoliata]
MIIHLTPSTGPPSLCEGSWCHSLANCELTFSDVADCDLPSIANCGLLQPNQLYSLCCTFRVRNIAEGKEKEVSAATVSPDYTCRMYFLQQDQRLEGVIADLKAASVGSILMTPVSGDSVNLPDIRYKPSDMMNNRFCDQCVSGRSESTGGQKTSAGGRQSSLLNSGANSRGGSFGIAGPPGGFPLMVAAETLAASFGVHMNRTQTIGMDPSSTRSPISLKKSGAATSKSATISVPLQQPSHESTAPSQDVTPSHHKSSLLRSTFARMRQVATGGGTMNSPTTTAATASSSIASSSSPLTTPSSGASAASTTTPSRTGFHQRLTHFSQTFAHDKSSPRRRKLEQIHRSYQSCQAPPSLDVVSNSESSDQPNEPHGRKKAQLHIPLTAVLEPNNSFIQSISDEVPAIRRWFLPKFISLDLGAANELAVTIPMQLAVVDSAIVAAKGGNRIYIETGSAEIPVGAVRGSKQQVAKHADNHPQDKRRSSSTSSMHRFPVDHSNDPGVESGSSSRFVNAPRAVKELNPHLSRRLLRRPTDPAMSLESSAVDPSELSQYEPPILYPERSLVGSLPLHQCARSTFSAFVPFVVELCVTLVEKFGLNCVGIYRVSGSKLAHDFMAAELCKQLGEIDATNEKWNDVHALACVLKTLLRNLPDSLIPKAMYPEFLSASRVESWERRLLSVQRLLSIMECYPKHPEYRVHRATLRYLATHLARVASRQAVNRMTAYNLALVFAPNLIQSSEDTPELFMADSKFKIWLLETIIKYHKWVFSPDLGLESGCFVPEDSEDQLLLTDEALAEAMAASSGASGLEFASQPGRSEGDVRPVLQEMLHAAALLPPPPSTSDLEVAEEPGPSRDRPTDVTTVVEQALESSAVEFQESQQTQQQHQRNRPFSQSGDEHRTHKQERSLSVGRHRAERSSLHIISENRCDVESKEKDPSLSARMQQTLLLPHRPSTAPASARNSNFNQSPKTSTAIAAISTNSKKPTPSSSSTRWNPFFNRHRRFSGEESQEKQPTIQSAVIEAGEEIYGISRLVAFRRAKSYRRRGDKVPEDEDELSAPPDRVPSQECLHQVLEEQQPAEMPPSPPIGNETSVRGRHHSLKKWWFH